MQQQELPIDGEGQEIEGALTREALESLPDEELWTKYNSATGIDIKWRPLIKKDKARVVNAILDPESEIQKLRNEDTSEDRVARDEEKHP